MEGISVVVCCYNSAPRIKDTLQYLAKQNVGIIPAEVILVNNNSSDDTVAIAVACWKEFNVGIPLRIIDEYTPGLSSARHTGITNAMYEYIVFCDDDNWLSENYLCAAFTTLKSDVNIGAVGGMGEPVYEVNPPDIVTQNVNQYAVGAQAQDSGDITQSKGYLYGAGIAIRKSVYNYLFQAGFAFTLEGRKGNILTSGEDFELCQAMILARYKIYYNRTLTFQHYLTKNRLTLEYLIRMNKGFGYSIAFLYPYIYLSSDKKLKGKSYSYILLKQIYKTVLTAFATLAGLRTLNGKLAWERDCSALKSLWENAGAIQKLCNTLSQQVWVQRKIVKD